MARRKDEYQIDMLEDVDRYEQAERDRKTAFIREKLKTFYMHPHDRYTFNNNDIPDGQVVIMEKGYVRTTKSNNYWTRFFRCVAGHHNTISGPTLHLISAPNEEWPDEPLWQPCHGVRWIYPDGGLWIRKEPEFDKKVQWSPECAECYGNCEDCKKMTGTYPRLRREQTEPAE